jgi:hypothetical protein
MYIFFPFFGVAQKCKEKKKEEEEEEEEEDIFNFGFLCFVLWVFC